MNAMNKYRSWSITNQLSYSTMYVSYRYYAPATRVVVPVPVLVMVLVVSHEQLVSESSNHLAKGIPVRKA